VGKARACTAMTKSRITRLLPAGFWVRRRPLRGPKPVTAERACPVGFSSGGNDDSCRERRSKDKAAGSGASVTPALRVALFEPDIPQNTGTILRLAACLGVEAHIIEPAGFPTTDRAFRRAGMDYLDQVAIVRHPSWETFEDWRSRASARLILFTTRARMSYLDQAFRRGDVLLFGRESSGAADKVHQAADARLVIPMREGMRSLNVAMAAAMAVGEAIRQITSVPAEEVGAR
jgi:tRNA (cytidine/uridine-2'-O-)-methyltransferase